MFELKCLRNILINIRKGIDMIYENMKTTKYSLSAPISLATRISKDTHNQRYRDRFMRDRDRVLYSKAFRRLAGKTQVYLAHFDEHKRTRLTHTLEVAQIAKTIASSLALNIDLTEAIALGHDIGHTPFGHAGESILHQLVTPISKDNSGKTISKYYIEGSPMAQDIDIEALKEYCGFKHNLQSVRVAVKLENMYESRGLDLTNFTLYGILNHSGLIYNEDVLRNDFMGFYDQLASYYMINNQQKAWSFEAYVVAEADEIAQRHHDLEDAIRGNIITKEDIISIIRDNFKDLMTPTDRANYKSLKKANSNYYAAILSRTVVNLLVTRLIKSSIYNLNSLIEKYNLTKKNFADFMILANINEMKSAIAYDKFGENTFKLRLKSFSKQISTRVISSYDIQRMDTKGQYIIRKLFEAFYSNPQQLSDNSIMSYFRESHIFNEEQIYNTIKKNGIGYIRHQFMEDMKDRNKVKDLILMRVICDHLSGMTDMFAFDTYGRLYGNVNDR